MRASLISLPNDADIYALTSPGFDAVYPSVINKELIPVSGDIPIWSFRAFGAA